MATIALQQELIEKISKIKSKKRLNAIKEYVEVELFHSNGAILLTPEMEQLIALSQKQIENGRYKTHEQVMAEAEQWLKENK